MLGTVHLRAFKRQAHTHQHMCIYIYLYMYIGMYSSYNTFKYNNKCTRVTLPRR